jgi:DNA ligase 1
MQAFAGLINRLVYTPSRNRKLDALADYFRATPDPDRGYALAALTDGLFVRLPLRRILSQLLEPHVDPVLYRLSRDYVGDTAETVALLWPEAATGRRPGRRPGWRKPSRPSPPPAASMRPASSPGSSTGSTPTGASPCSSS